MSLTKSDRRQRIQYRIRKIVSGTAARPRLSVFRSNKEIYAQLIDDVNGTTLAAVSSRDKGVDSKGTNVEVATTVGKLIGEVALESTPLSLDETAANVVPLTSSISCA